ncbi:hypothetical protein B0H14DRAFT_2616977 [Mycena olivaceomarginata]|nr:hypothetical protein B0H14DRAFT_2616977 [Mycena olivaceomarginata]
MSDVGNAQGSSVEHNAGWCLALHVPCCVGAKASPDRRFALGMYYSTRLRDAIETPRGQAWSTKPAGAWHSASRAARVLMHPQTGVLPLVYYPTQDSKITIETPRGQAWSTKPAGAWRSTSRAARVLMHAQTGVLHLGCIIRHTRCRWMLVTRRGLQDHNRNAQGSSVEHKAGWCLALCVPCCAGANASPDRFFAPGVLFDTRNAAECRLRAQDSKNTIGTPRGQAWSTKPAGAWRSTSRAARVLMHPQTGVLPLVYYSTQDSKITIETPRGQAWSTKPAGAWRSTSRAARVLMHPQTGVLHLGCIIRHTRCHWMLVTHTGLQEHDTYLHEQEVGSTTCKTRVNRGAFVPTYNTAHSEFKVLQSFLQGNPLPQKCGNGFWVIRYRKNCGNGFGDAFFFGRVIRYRIFAVTDFELVFFWRVIRYRIFAVTDFGMGVALPHFCGNGF